MGRIMFVHKHIYNQTYGNGERVSRKNAFSGEIFPVNRAGKGREGGRTSVMILNELV